MINKNLQIPEELKKEVLILRKLGLENYEIKYLIELKSRELPENNENEI